MAAPDMDDKTRTELEAAAFRRLVLRSHGEAASAAVARAAP